MVIFMVNKNEIYEITIEDIGTEGQGIGHVDGEAVFVKDTLPGDKAVIKIIKAKKNMAYGRLMELVEASPARTEPKCCISRSCGGCTLQHMDYNEQLAFKWNKVKNLLQRIGGIEEPEKLMEYVIDRGDDSGISGKTDDSVNPEKTDDSVNPEKTDDLVNPEHKKLAYGLKTPFHYRNKMQFPVGRDKEGKAVLGFYAGRTHSIIPLTDCVIGHPVNKGIIKAVMGYMDKYKISVYDEEKHTGLVRHVLTRVGFHTGELMVCLVVNGDEIPHAEELYRNIEQAVDDFNNTHVVEAGEGNLNINDNTILTECGTNSNLNVTDDKAGRITFKSFMININKDKTNRILGFSSKVLRGEGFITDYIGDIRFSISPESFFQVNPAMTEKLYNKALEYARLTGGEKVWDMYCGIGSISLFLAQKAKKVFGVEIVPQAIEDAEKNAALNGLTNAEFFTGKAEEVVPELYEKDHDRYSADVVVVDPPRKGCDEKLLDTICSMAPKRLVYVSCDPATLARDIKYLSEKGFKLEKAAVYDQFSHGVHVETVALIERVRNAKDFIQIGEKLCIMNI
ncbi:23S rRNA (uracil1939-C5)-methyltransferase [Eubacterium ruminantium]|nr:23S rRNA (uracil1939-C5)-methyltransferase [Eubacterium ruminantium]